MSSQPLWKAAKVAAVAFGGLLAFFFLIVGVTAALGVHGHEERRTTQVDRSPKGQDGETRLDRNDERAVAESDAPKGES